MQLSLVSAHCRTKMWHLFFCSLMILNILENFTTIATDEVSVDKYIEQGTRLLAAGQIAEALAQYNLAIEKDDKNYLSFFRRATAYMALGKSKSAITDLDVVLELNPNLHPARKQRANLLFKSGEPTLAMSDHGYLINFEEYASDSRAAQAEIMEIMRFADAGRSSYEAEDYNSAVEYLSRALDSMVFSKELREMRAKSYLKLGEKQKAIADFRQSVKQTTDNTDGILKLSLLMYEAGDPELSLQEIRECLKLDPDHKACFDHYKMVKKLAKQFQDIQEALNGDKFDECVTKARKIMTDHKHIPEYTSLMRHYLCKCQVKSNPKDAIQECTQLIELEPSNYDFICDRAEAYLNNDQYDEAIDDYQKVLENQRDHSRAKSGIKRAQKMLKNSQKRDYYKILGVTRSASKRDILKAYRKLAAEWHPDHYKGTDKKMAEKMFIDISAAKEVLSDPEKRQKFDNGDDPLDPENQHQGGDPFGGFTFHNFNPFGSDTRFEFHFG